jgi:hypothetical protein
MFRSGVFRDVASSPLRASGVRRLRSPRARSDWFAALVRSERGEAVDPETLASVL